MKTDLFTTSSQVDACCLRPIRGNSVYLPTTSPTIIDDASVLAQILSDGIRGNCGWAILGKNKTLEGCPTISCNFYGAALGYNWNEVSDYSSRVIWAGSYCEFSNKHFILLRFEPVGYKLWKFKSCLKLDFVIKPERDRPVLWLAWAFGAFGVFGTPEGDPVGEKDKEDDNT